MTTEMYLTDYCPENVTACLTMGTNGFIGVVDATTVLKYPHIPGDHIIGFKGLTKDGLLLERAPFGSIADYLANHNPGRQQRLKWAYQAAEALAAVHQKRVLHRDVAAHNLLLDAELNVKLSDFQGRLLSPDGKVEVDGLSVENTKAFMPRVDFDHADWRTKVFALASAFYYILQGHEAYPELHPDRDEEQIVERFVSGRFPDVECSAMNRVIHRCWAGGYESVDAVLQGLGFVRGCSVHGGVEAR
ncbi:hypothetical protein MMC30_005245 [Trapelia coarctata]|nr:hypothetical protein [Trapelia coarctata]